MIQSLSNCVLFANFNIGLLGDVFVGNEGMISQFTRHLIANVSCGKKDK